MAGFQLAGPVADVSKSLYGKIELLMQRPSEQYTTDGCVPVCLRKNSTEAEPNGHALSMEL